MHPRLEVQCSQQDLPDHRVVCRYELMKLGVPGIKQKGHQRQEVYRLRLEADKRPVSEWYVEPNSVYSNRWTANSALGNIEHTVDRDTPTLLYGTFSHDGTFPLLFKAWRRPLHPENSAWDDVEGLYLIPATRNAGQPHPSPPSYMDIVKRRLASMRAARRTVA